MHCRVQALGLVEFVAAADMEAGAQPRHRVGFRLAPGDGVVREDDVHEVVQVDVRLEALVAVPDVEAITARRTREVDADVLLEHLGVRRVQGIGEAVQLGHLLEGRQKAEADDVEQRHGPACDVIDPVATNHLLDDLRLDVAAAQRLAERNVDGLHVEKACDFLHLDEVELPVAGDQFGDETRRYAGRIVAGLRRRVLGDRVVRNDERENSLVERCPGKDVVLAERPVRVQCALELDEVAALPEHHLLGQPGQLIQVR